MRTLRWYGLLIIAKAVLLHRLGVPTEVAVPFSGGTTGIVWAMVEDKRRIDRKEW